MVIVKSPRCSEELTVCYADNWCQLCVVEAPVWDMCEAFNSPACFHNSPSQAALTCKEMHVGHSVIGNSVQVVLNDIVCRVPGFTRKHK